MDSAEILLVENIRIWRRRLRKILEGEGYEVETAVSYGEAFGKMRQGSFDLVVTDLRLGPEDPPRGFEERDLDGMALLDDACERQIPTIVVTGYGTVELARRAYEDYDVVQFLGKQNFEAERFREIVRQALMPPVPKAAAFLFERGIIEAIPDDFLEVVSTTVSKTKEERALALLEQIREHTRNLNTLEGQKVRYSIDVPLHIENGIEYEKAEIRKKEGQLRKLLEEMYKKQLR